MFLKKIFRLLVFFFFGASIGLFLLFLTTYAAYYSAYHDRVYPGIFLKHLNFSNWTKQEVQEFFEKQNQILKLTQFSFLVGDQKVVLAGQDLSLKFDSAALSQKVYQVGRNQSFFSNLLTQLQIFFQTLSLPLDYQFDLNLIQAKLKNLQNSVVLPAQNAVLHFENGQLTVTEPEKTGQELDFETLSSDLKTEIDNLILHPQINSPLNLELKVKKVLPQVTAANASALGLKQLLGEGISYFLNSSPERIYNLVLASAKFNSVLLKPNTTFSFNQILGEVSEKTGYRQAWIIKEGKTILGDGGGVCQVSTTAFRAALNSGLPIIERQAHAYRVSFYEEKSPVGFDATVYEPSPDFRFLNDTPAYLLIQTAIDLLEKKLTFEFIGTQDGREVSLSQPEITAPIPAPPPLYQEDPSLPLGVVKQIDWAAGGATVKFDYQVKRGGEVLFQKTFQSVYRPWRAVYLKGIKNP